jgi:hypothetical protein
LEDNGRLLRRKKILSSSRSSQRKCRVVDAGPSGNSVSLETYILHVSSCYAPRSLQSSLPTRITLSMRHQKASVQHLSCTRREMSATALDSRSFIPAKTYVSGKQRFSYQHHDLIQLHVTSDWLPRGRLIASGARYPLWKTRTDIHPTTLTEST